MLELQQFVSGVITQIMEGVREAQSAAQESGARVNPKEMRTTWSAGPEVKYFDQQSGNAAHMIEFDVAVTAGAEKQLKGGAGIFVAGVIGLGSQAQSDSISNTISRVKFSVPVFYPVQE